MKGTQEGWRAITPEKDSQGYKIRTLSAVFIFPIPFSICWAMHESCKLDDLLNETKEQDKFEVQLDETLNVEEESDELAQQGYTLYLY